MIRHVLLLAALVFAGGAAAAGAPFLEEMTSTEVREAIAAGRTTILVPIGGTEQNGAHMVLGKHNERARILAGRIAERLGNALVAPVVAYVPEGAIAPPAAHMRYAGTISIPADAFEKLLAGAARSFRQHGFRDVVFLGDHGGYLGNVEKVAAELNREWKGAAHAYAPPEYYRAATADFGKFLRDQGYTAAQIGQHAGLADTSLALAVDPGLVRKERLAEAPTQGVDGDQRRSTAQLGERGVALIVEKTVAAIEKAIGSAHAGR